MDRGVAVLLTAFGGGLIALQPPINAELGRFTGNIQAGFVSFAVGALLIGAIMVLSGKAGTLSHAFQPGWIYYLGPVLGALIAATAYEYLYLRPLQPPVVGTPESGVAEPRPGDTALD